MEENRNHLIERAAARLNASVPPLTASATATAPFLKAPQGPVTAPLPDANGHSVLIDEAALIKGGLIDWEQLNNRAAEEFRIVQNELLQAELVGEANRNIIMITSALPGEGKSFTALNLSAGIARHGQRGVLLVDADAKAGGLGQLLAPAEAPGLFDVIDGGRLDVGKFALRTAIDNLDFLPMGNSTGRDSDLLSSQKMGDLIQQIGRTCSDKIIVLDAPPCLMSSAPNTLAPLVGRVVLVVEANATQEGDMNAAIEILHSCKNLSIILNKIPAWIGQSFGAYYA